MTQKWLCGSFVVCVCCVLCAFVVCYVRYIQLPLKASIPPGVQLNTVSFHLCFHGKLAHLVSGTEMLNANTNAKYKYIKLIYTYLCSGT